MAREYIAVQTEMQQYMARYSDVIEKYRDEKKFMDHMDPLDPLKAGVKQALADKYDWVMRPLMRLQSEREEAYHNQKSRDTKMVKDDFRSRLDINHPMNPLGARMHDPNWTPEKARAVGYGPGGSLRERKVILLPR